MTIKPYTDNEAENTSHYIFSSPESFYTTWGKRLLDIVLSLLAIIVLSPLIALIAILVKVKLGSPIIFKQERPGLNEKVFVLCKFRTMNDLKDENNQLLPDSMRLTKFGRWLRSTSLDELPELYNILKGDMSIVGPRPLCVIYLPFYNEMEKHRHDVRPGLSGLAQINGRSEAVWEERFAYDLEYIRSITFLGDAKIVFKTIFAVLKRSGTEGTAMTDFNEYRINSEKQEHEQIERDCRVPYGERK